jgi:hypothetical protein
VLACLAHQEVRVSEPTKQDAIGFILAVWAFWVICCTAAHLAPLGV